MKCDVCDSEKATLFFTQLVEGKKKKVNLCKTCADDKGVTDPTGFALADMLEGMGQEEVIAEPTLHSSEKKCEVCGFTQSDFKKTGRFGCSACYLVFNDGLDSLLEAMHKNTRHKGKQPTKFEESIVSTTPEPEIPDTNRLDELRDNLKASVEAEDYEEAARLRDAIAQLEAEIGAPERTGDS